MKIAIFGKLRAGKSAVCQILKDNLEGVEVIEFSDALKEVVDILHPELDGVKDREIMIETGQHLRKLDDDIWVDIVKHKIATSKASNIVVSGVRQKNEYEMLKKEGFVFVKIDSNKNTRIKRCEECGDNFDPKSLNNPTELVMDGFEYDYSITNNNSFKDLEISAKNLIGDILSKEYCTSVRNNLFKLKTGGENIG